jgi:hypothetical protein
LLERDRNQLLDLLGREPQRFRLDFDVRRRELGQTSTGIDLSCATPSTTTPAASAPINRPNRKPSSTNQRIAPPSIATDSAAMARLSRQTMFERRPVG